MITITVYFHDRKWRVRRSDREVATTTNRVFILLLINAILLAFQLQSRFVLMSKDGIGVGNIDFFRVEVADEPMEDVTTEEIESELDQIEVGSDE